MISVEFVDFLRVTVMLSAAAATALVVITVLSAAPGSASVVFICAGWWVLAAATGAWLGRRSQVSPRIAHLLASANATRALPQYRPTGIIFNRLWPLLLYTVIAGALALLAPQIPGIAAGFAIAWALSWRRQDAAVEAIEERDGVRFYVVATSPVRAIRLERAPGFTAIRPPERVNGAAT